MIDRLVIHIGDPKNGSTSIQTALHTRAWQCETLSIAPQPELNALLLANTLKPDRPVDLRREAFLEKVDWVTRTDADIGVMSSEYFFNVRPEALLAALEEYLPDHAHTVRLIAYVRPHAARLVSTYAQQIKSGAFNRELPVFLNQVKHRPPLQYFPRFSRWRAVFGDRFVLRPFIRTELHAQEVVADFFHQVTQGAAVQLADTEVMNEGLFLKEIAGFRVIQRVLMDEDVPQSLRTVIGGAIGRCLNALPNRSGIKMSLNRRTVQDVAVVFRADARKVDQMFFDAPLLEPALDDAVQAVIPERQLTHAKRFFEPAELNALRRVARRVAQVNAEDVYAFRSANRMLKGALEAREFDGMLQRDRDFCNTALDLARRAAALIV